MNLDGEIVGCLLGNSDVISVEADYKIRRESHIPGKCVTRIMLVAWAVHLRNNMGATRQSCARRRQSMA